MKFILVLFISLVVLIAVVDGQCFIHEAASPKGMYLFKFNLFCF